MALALIALIQAVLVSEVQAAGFMVEMDMMGVVVVEASGCRLTIRVGGRSMSMLPPVEGKRGLLCEPAGK